MKSYRVRVSPNPMTEVLTIRQKYGHSLIERRPREDGGRDGSDASINQGPQEFWPPLVAERIEEVSSSRDFRGSMALLTS